MKKFDSALGDGPEIWHMLVSKNAFATDIGICYSNYVQNRMSVGLCYDANFKWQMPIWEGICRAEQTYMPFLALSPGAISGKNSKLSNIYKWCIAVLWIFFPENTLGDGPAFCIFSGFTDIGGSTLDWNIDFGLTHIRLKHFTLSKSVLVLK